MMVGFVCGAFLVGYTVRVFLTILSSSFGAVARLTDSELVRHGAPIALGVAFFIYVVASKKVRNWANEVIIEVGKVVWPSRKDTTAMTIVVCFFMILSGVILFAFDFVSSKIIQFILEMA